MASGIETHGWLHNGPRELNTTITGFEKELPVAVRAS